MHIWIEFLILIYWLTILSFILNYNNFLIFFFFSEFMWLVLYSLTSVSSVLFDELNLMGLTFFFLGLAGLEFSIGFMILLIFKTFKISLNIYQNDKEIDFFFKNNKSTLFLENFFWIK